MCQRIPWKQYGFIVTIAGAPWAMTAWKQCNSKQNYLESEVCIFWDVGTLGFGVRPPGLSKTIKKLSVVRWGSLRPGAPRCPQMKTSSYWRHMNNKVFISEPQCDKMYIFNYLFIWGGGSMLCPMFIRNLTNEDLIILETYEQQGFHIWATMWQNVHF